MSKKKINGLLFNYEESIYQDVTIESDENGCTLYGMQKIVDGYIEIPLLSRTLSSRGIDIVINEEGLFRDDFKVTGAIISGDDVLCTIRGPILFVSHNDEGDSISLNEEQMNFLLNEMNTICNIESLNGDYYAGVLVIPA